MIIYTPTRDRFEAEVESLAAEMYCDKDKVKAMARTYLILQDELNELWQKYKRLYNERN